ncbi:MAG: radical SAM protein [Chloroflexota bacterium]|nr:radical SAM protein [Chloroflexota bacterium]
MRVLLISTPYPLEENPIPPLSLSYLAAVLRNDGVEVRIMDHLVSKYSPDKLKRELASFKPNIVGATCVTLNYPIAVRIMHVCKNFDPNIVTMLGGPHATFALKETLLRAPWIDLVVIGEGEWTTIELARAIAKGQDYHDVKGIAYRSNGKVARTEQREIIEDLNELPLPARELLPLSKYRALDAPCTVVTSRGCPFQCIFCSGPRLFGRRVRFRDPSLVLEEIEQIHKVLGFKKINIVDDTFTLNERHAKAVCKGIIDRNLKIKWNVFARADTVKPDMLSIMREAGCEWLLYGAESGNPEILRTIKKGTTPDIIRHGTKLATEAGIKVFNSFIFGLPGETPETARESMNFAKELDEKYGAKYGFHILSPLPGTELYDNPEDYGLRILSRNWAKYDANKPITETEHMSPEQVLEISGEYDRAVGYVWDDIERRAKEGDPDCQEQVHKKISVDFIWNLLQSDIIEHAGRTNNGTNPVKELACKVASKLGTPLDVAEQELSILEKKGLLKYKSSGNGVIWQWS